MTATAISPSTAPSTGELCDDYRRWMLERGLSPDTIHQRVSFLERRLADWGGLDVTPGEVAAWLGRYAGWTRRTYLNHLTSIYAWAEDTGRATSPIGRYRIVGNPKPKPNPLSETEVGRALGAATGDLRAFLLLGLHAGLRAHEIAKFAGGDITERTIFVLGKGGKPATLPTHPALWALAQQYPCEGLWFSSRYGRLSDQPVHRGGSATTSGTCSGRWASRRARSTGCATRSERGWRALAFPRG